MAGGVAAAFCVRLTADASGLKDAIDRAIRLRRGLKTRLGSARKEMVAPYPVGFLSHSHSWQSSNDHSRESAARILDAGHNTCNHPAEILDFACIADLGTWWTPRVPYLPPWVLAMQPIATDTQKKQGAAVSAVIGSFPSDSPNFSPNNPNPVAVFVASLFMRLSYSDSSMKATADAFTVTNTQGGGQGPQRLWDLEQVFSEPVRKLLPSRALSGSDEDWLSAY